MKAPSRLPRSAGLRSRTSADETALDTVFRHQRRHLLVGVACSSGIWTSSTNDINHAATILSTGFDGVARRGPSRRAAAPMSEATVALRPGRPVIAGFEHSRRSGTSSLDCTCADAKHGLSLSGSTVHPLDGIAARGVYSRGPRESGFCAFLDACARRSADCTGPGRRSCRIQFQGRAGARGSIVARFFTSASSPVAITPSCTPAATILRRQPLVEDLTDTSMPPAYGAPDPDAPAIAGPRLRLEPGRPAARARPRANQRCSNDTRPWPFARPECERMTHRYEGPPSSSPPAWEPSTIRSAAEPWWSCGL